MNNFKRGEIDVLLAHPLKHHIYPIVPEAIRRGLDICLATGFYNKGVVRALSSILPARATEKLGGYEIPGDFGGRVLCGLFDQTERIRLRRNLPEFYSRFDEKICNLIRSRNIRPKLVHTLQNYMPLTQQAALDCGAELIYDCIIDSSLGVYQQLAARAFQSDLAHRPVFNKSEIWVRSNLINASRVFVPNSVIGEHLNVDYGVAGDRIRVIPYGCDLSRFQYSNILERKPGLVVVRANELRKGAVEFLDSLPIIANELNEEWHFRVVGDLEIGLVEKLREIRSRLPAHLTVAFGPVDFAAMADLLKNASALVMPTYREGMSLIVLEALASGTPVITSQHSGVDGLKSNENCIVLNSISADEMAAATIRLLGDKSLAEELSRNGRSLVSRYCSSSYSHSVVGEYEEVLNR